MPELFIYNDGQWFSPVVQDGVTWETERFGSPGKLTFSVINTNYGGGEVINIQEGDTVKLKVDGRDVFYGFIFTKKRDKDQIISITAYDQLRYLKNKDVKKYDNLTTAGLIREIAEDYFLECGELEDSGTALSHIHDGDTLFDMILYSMQETARITGGGCVFYDDFGKLTLKSLEHMTLDCLIAENTAENFDYQSSIDSGTYNYIRLVYENSDTGKWDLYETKDSENIQRWGRLQYFEKVNKEDNKIAKAEAMLKMYDGKRRTLSVSGAFGDIRVRGGSLVPVILTLGDVDAKSYLLVDKAKHTFKDGRHTMDLTLRGNVFV